MKELNRDELLKVKGGEETPGMNFDFKASWA